MCLICMKYRIIILIIIIISLGQILLSYTANTSHTHARTSTHTHQRGIQVIAVRWVSGAIGVRDGGSGGQLPPQFGPIYDIYSGKRQDICLTNCVTPNGTSVHLPEIHFGWGKTGDVHRVILYDRQK